LISVSLGAGLSPLYFFCQYTKIIILIWGEKIKKLLKKAADAVIAAPEKIRDLFLSLFGPGKRVFTEKKEAFSSLVTGIPEKTFRLIQFGALGLSGLALILLVLSMVIRSGSSQTEAVLPPPRAPEDFFPADEPDYIPQVLLEREPRSSWTAEDAGSSWTNPLDQGEEVWKGRLKAAVDELLESVP
jgi:hypothetical protein